MFETTRNIGLCIDGRRREFWTVLMGSLRKWWDDGNIATAWTSMRDYWWVVVRVFFRPRVWWVIVTRIETRYGISHGNANLAPLRWNVSAFLNFYIRRSGVPWSTWLRSVWRWCAYGGSVSVTKYCGRCDRRHLGPDNWKQIVGMLFLLSWYHLDKKCTEPKSTGGR